MAVGIRELKNRAPEILREVEERGSVVVVTRYGRPAALILPIDSAEAEDYALAHAPEIVASLRGTRAELRKGLTTTLAAYRKRRGL